MSNILSTYNIIEKWRHFQQKSTWYHYDDVNDQLKKLASTDSHAECGNTMISNLGVMWYFCLFSPTKNVLEKYFV